MNERPSESAWKLLNRIFKRLPILSEGRAVWIAQPEASSAFFETLALLPQPKKTVYQTFKPEVNAIASRHRECTQSLDSTRFDLAICVPTKQRIESLGLLAHALKHAAHVLFICPNSLGAGGFLTRLEDAVDGLETDSGEKCRWALVDATQARPGVVEAWLAEAAPVEAPGTSYQSLPGIFGWNKIDRGSELLLQTIVSLKGRGADLGCGYGYLSAEIARRFGVDAIELVEADARALECARANVPVGHAHWLDVTAPEGRFARDLDWVVMNPPFHQGAAVKSAVGLAFIEAAAAILAPNGTLYMVANEFLPYEEALQKSFRDFKRVLHAEGFKVIHARR